MGRPPPEQLGFGGDFCAEPEPLDVSAYDEQGLALALEPRAVQREKLGAILWATTLAGIYGGQIKDGLAAAAQLRKFANLDYDPSTDTDGQRATASMSLSEQIQELADALPEILGQLPEHQRRRILDSLARSGVQ